MENAIKWFSDRRGKVTYSMTHRMGPNSYDCSSAVYLSLKQAGIIPQNTYVGNTDTLFNDLEKNGFTQLPRKANGDVDAQRGDIFIWGKRGASTGAAGHTGIMTDAVNMIHCNYGHNGISVNPHDAIWAINGGPEYTFYRYTGQPQSLPFSRGESVRVKDTHIVESRSTVHGITQVMSKSLYISNGNWTDNGVPVAGINKVDKDGYWLSGTTNVGERFVVPGLFTVNDAIQDQGRYYVLLKIGGYEVWIVDSAIEKSSTGTPKPVSRPVQTPAPHQTSTPKPVQTPAPTPEPTPQPTPVTETPIPETPRPIETSPPETEAPIIPTEEEKPKMAFSKEQVADLKIQTERLEDKLLEVSESEEVQKVVDSFSPKTKRTVYIIGDSLIIIGALVPQIVIALALNLSVEQIVAWSGLFATAGGSILLAFGLLKGSKKS